MASWIYWYLYLWLADFMEIPSSLPHTSPPPSSHIPTPSSSPSQRVTLQGGRWGGKVLKNV